MTADKYEVLKAILNLTKFSSNKKLKSPNTIDAAKSCKGKPPLNIDSLRRNKNVKQKQ